ncbi:RHS repeat-associated core domain-containing protein [Pseudomonas fragi]|uniref:RHS repeat-associated core domain-containing protein n=1 Tax=Pseudomonas fragi TaxID=296 RepID=UPI000B4C290B|nr:RHS repeat-associated core domain-containing protein [Pseudomonas fragi]ASC85580.1 hypothetical protein CDA60_03785 [Pseudomonas fragi]
MPQALHRHTPTLSACDPRGLPVRQVAYHRRSAAQLAEARISRQVFGPTGHVGELWDARLLALRSQDPATVANQRNRHSLSGRLLHSTHVDRGVRITLAGAGAQLRYSWDARGTRHTCEYDGLLRLSAVFEQGADAATGRCVERLSYADNRAEHRLLNCCGRLVRHNDPAGTLWFEGYDLLGQVTSQSRRFVRDISLPPDWPVHSAGREPYLEPGSWRTQWRHDATGQLIEQTDARGNRQVFQQGVDGLLTSLRVRTGSSTEQRVIEQRTYTANGQIEVERAGNGVVSVLTYNPLDDRLQRRQTWRTGKPGEPLQDLTYTYDRVGNVLRLADAAQPLQWADNNRVQAVSSYVYDTLYQLIEATGRESSDPACGPQLPGIALFSGGNAQRLRNYRQVYTYDAGGNLARLQHIPSHGSGYTRQMRLAQRSNHGLEQMPGVAASQGPGSGFDGNGNQQRLAPGQALAWTLRNQLQRVTLVARADGANDEEICVYDGSGARVIKVRQRNGHRLPRNEAVYYLPGLEIRRNSATGEWLDVLTVAGELSSARILHWEQGRPADIDNRQLRLSLTDHLGSSTLELDGAARLLSQESCYPYGATAWWAARSAIEASYKHVRYSGKERDASGLYYYGYRYYAPWLGRWISADPGDTVDGLNLYAMARGNPISRRDEQGLQSSEVAGQGSLVATVKGVATGVSNLVRSRLQASSAAAIRDALATYISNAIGAGVDIALFEGRQPSSAANTALRSVVAALDALTMMHMTTGVFGHLTRWSPFIGFFAASAVDRGFEMRGAIEGTGGSQAWDPVARLRLAGHVRAFSREIVQQALSGLGDSVVWGQTPVPARIPRTLMAAGAYSLATIPGAVYGHYVPGPLVSNLAPAIEAYDAAAGTWIRAGHPTAHLERHAQTLQLPALMDTAQGGLSRMFNQTWSYWAGVGIEAIAAFATGVPIARQSARARAWVGAAKGVVSALTEVRGLLLQTARSGYSSLFARWRTARG